MEQILNFLLNFSGFPLYFLLFGVLLLCGLGLPLPEDVTLFAGGLAVYEQKIDLWMTIVTCYVGVILGDSIIFFLGHYYGPQLTNRWFFKKILTKQRLKTVQEKLHRQGNRLIFAARFMPGLRAPIYFSTGMLHLPYRVFFFYDGIAALISVPTIIVLVYSFGDQIIQWIKKVEHSIFLLILAIIVFYLLKSYINKKNTVHSHGS